MEPFIIEVVTDRSEGFPRSIPEKTTIYVTCHRTRVSLGYQKKQKPKKKILINNSCNSKRQSRQCIFSLSSVIRAHTILCGLLVNFQEHSCQLEREAVTVQPLDLFTVEK